MTEKTNKPLNKIIRETKGNKKFKVFVKDQSSGNIKTIRFGDANMSIKRDDQQEENLLWLGIKQH